MISVIMPVYNGADFLQQTIESVLNQTEKNFELIIINDGSTDGSEAIIRSFSDTRIKYFTQANSGPAAARNKGLDHARGDYIVIQDADDISLPQRFAILKDNLTSPEAGIVHSDIMLINENNQPIGYWAANNLPKKNMLRFFLKVGTPFNNNSVMLRQEALQGIRYDTSLRVAEDSDLMLQVAKNWDAIHVPQPLLLYRRHSHNISKTQDYKILHDHVHKLLQHSPLNKLIPELAWQNSNEEASQAKACAIISLFLLRRGMIPDCQIWYNKALKVADPLIYAIGNMIVGKYEAAIKLLSSHTNDDPVVLNYLGECFALTGELMKAHQHFMLALQLKPDYEEPLDNLKGLVSLNKVGFIDKAWSKFPQL